MAYILNNSKLPGNAVWHKISYIKSAFAEHI